MQWRILILFTFDIADLSSLNKMWTLNSSVGEMKSFTQHLDLSGYTTNKSIIF